MTGRSKFRQVVFLAKQCLSACIICGWQSSFALRASKTERFRYGKGRRHHKNSKNPSSKNEFPARKQGLKARSCVAYWKQSGCHLPHSASTAVCSSVSGISQKWQITRSKNNNSLILAFMGTMGKWTLNWTINYYVPDIFSSMYLLLIFFVSSLFGNIWGISQVTQPSVALHRQKACHAILSSSSICAKKEMKWNCEI